jgi:hypothetical protein
MITLEQLFIAVAHIDQSNWIKPLSSLLKEVKDGDCRITLKPLLRELNVGFCHIYNNGEKLVETDVRFRSGKIKTTGQPVGGKLRTNYDPEEEMLREISEELGYDLKTLNNELKNGNLKFKIKKKVDSPNGERSAYPGLPSRWNEYHYEWNMPDKLRQPSYKEEAEDKISIFGWIPNK